jgi:hypothetical protein
MNPRDEQRLRKLEKRAKEEKMLSNIGCAFIVLVLLGLVGGFLFNYFTGAYNDGGHWLSR